MKHQSKNGFITNRGTNHVYKHVQKGMIFNTTKECVLGSVRSIVQDKIKDQGDRNPDLDSNQSTSWLCNFNCGQGRVLFVYI